MSERYSVSLRESILERVRECQRESVRKREFLSDRGCKRASV